MGRVESGEIKVGDNVTVLPNGRTSKVKDIQLYGQSIGKAIHEQSVTVLLEDEIDISRGDMIVNSDEVPAQSKQVEAVVCWLSEAPLSPARTYWLRHTTREVKAKVAGIAHRVDVNSLAKESATTLAMNDIAQLTLKLAQPIFADNYTDSRATGAFILIDESSNNTVGAGMIVG